jgi:hypothetical protein
VQHDGYELVHFNFAMAKRPLDHPDMTGFTSLSLVDGSPVRK